MVRPKSACVFCAVSRKKCVRITNTDGCIIGCVRCKARNYECTLIPDANNSNSNSDDGSDIISRFFQASNSDETSTCVDDSDDEDYTGSPFDPDGRHNSGSARDATSGEGRDSVSSPSSDGGLDDDAGNSSIIDAGNSSIASFGGTDDEASPEETSLFGSDSEYEDDEVKGGGSKLKFLLTKPNSFFSWLDAKKIYGAKENDVIEFVDTNCRGGARLFSILDPTRCHISVDFIQKRVKRTSSTTIMRFMETRNLSAKGLGSHCHGNVIMFTEGNDVWKFGIIDTLQYDVEVADRVVDVVLRLYEWKIDGDESAYPPSENGIPWAFCQKSWDEAKKHFIHRVFHWPQSKVQIAFVNQVLGPIYSGFRSDTINTSDTAVQTSPSGPDLFHPMPTKSALMKTVKSQEVEVDTDQDFFTVDNGRHKKRRYHKKPLKKFKSVYVKNFIGYDYLVAQCAVTTRYTVISSIDNDFDPQSMKTSKPALTSNYTIPYLHDSGHNDTCLRRFHVISRQQLKKLIDDYSMSVFSWNDLHQVDSIISSYCTEEFLSVRTCNMASHNGQEHFTNSIMFAGMSAPNLSSGLVELEEPFIDGSRGLVMNTCVSENGLFQHYCPVAACYMSSLTHVRQFEYEDISKFVDAVGDRQGTCQKRTRQGAHRGYLMYSGKRASDAVLMPSVHQGPGDMGRYDYSNQKSVPLLMPRLLKILNHVACKTAYSSRYFFKYLHVTAATAFTHLWIASIVILTMNFYNCSHCDEGDSDPGILDEIVAELESVINSVPASPKRNVEEANNYLSFIREFDNPLPSTCCYQRINHPGYKDASSWTSHYYFVMDGMSSCFKIFDKMTITFCGSVFQHNTSVPLFSKDNGDGTFQLCIGKHELITWLAWGASKNSSKSRRSRRRRN